MNTNQKHLCILENNLVLYFKNPKTCPFDTTNFFLEI